MLFWGVLDPFLDLKGIKIFFFTNIYVYNYFLGQTKPFATSNRDRLDTPKINLNVHWAGVQLHFDLHSEHTSPSDFKYCDNTVNKVNKSFSDKVR